MEAMTQKALFISFLVSLARLHKSYDIWQEVIDFILSLSVAPELFGQPGFKFITWLKRSHGWAKRRVCQPILPCHKFSYIIILVNELPLHACIDFVYQTLKKMLKRKTIKALSMHLGGKSSGDHGRDTSVRFKWPVAPNDPKLSKIRNFAKKTMSLKWKKVWHTCPSSIFHITMPLSFISKLW